MITNVYLHARYILQALARGSLRAIQRAGCPQSSILMASKASTVYVAAGALLRFDPSVLLRGGSVSFIRTFGSAPKGTVGAQCTLAMFHLCILAPRQRPSEHLAPRSLQESTALALGSVLHGSCDRGCCKGTHCMGDH